MLTTEPSSLYALEMEFLGMNKKHIRAAGYPRVSDTGLKDSKTLESQAKAIREHMQQQGYDCSDTHMYPEADTAYMKPFRERKKFMEMLDAARRHEFEVLVVTEFARLSRRQVEQAVIIDILEKYGVRVESVTEKFEDSPIGHFMRAVYAFIAEVEREKIYYRTQRGKRDRVQNGNLTGQGNPTYGYSYIDTDDETSARYIPNATVIYVDADGIMWTEVSVVLYIFDLAQQGTSVRKICMLLTQQGIPTPRGGKPYWKWSTVHRILTNRRYIGECTVWKTKREGDSVTQRPEEEQVRLPDGVVPPIVEIAVFEEVQRRLGENKQESLRNNRHPDNLGLLRSGYVRCGICNKTMSVHYSTDRKRNEVRPSYECDLKTGSEDYAYHHGTKIGIELLDREAWDIARMYIYEPELVRAHVAKLKEELKQPTDREDVEKELAVIRRKIHNIYKLAEEVDDEDGILVLQMRLKDLQRQKHDAEAMLYDIEEEEEEKEQLAQEIQRFEAWAYQAQAKLDDPDYNPTYEEKRLAIKILGVQALVWPVSGSFPHRAKIDVLPPNIMSLISKNKKRCLNSS